MLLESITPGKLLLAAWVKESENTNPRASQEDTIFPRTHAEPQLNNIPFPFPEVPSYSKSGIVEKKAVGEQPIQSKQYLSKQTGMTQTLKHEVLKENYMNRTGIISNYSLFMKQIHGNEKAACVTHTLRYVQKKKAVSMHQKNRQLKTHLMIEKLQAKQKLRGRIGRRQDSSLK